MMGYVPTTIRGILAMLVRMGWWKLRTAITKARAAIKARGAK